MNKLCLLSIVLCTSCVGFLQLKPEVEPEYNVLLCKAKVLVPYVGSLEQAVSAVITTESTDGADAGKLLLSLGVPIAKLQDVIKAYRACGKPTPLPVQPQDLTPSQDELPNQS